MIGFIEMLKVNGLEVKVADQPDCPGQSMGDIQKIMQWVEMSSALGPEGRCRSRPAASLTMWQTRWASPQICAQRRRSSR